MGEGGSFHLAADTMYLVSADSGILMGGVASWKTDGYLLCIYFLQRGLFRVAGDGSAKLGNLGDHGGVFGIWNGSDCQSFLF